jgi:hypothetical protein
MPAKHYSSIFKEINSCKFLKIQSLTLFIITYVDWTLIPFVTKFEGTYLPVFMISFYMLIGALDGFVQPLFKNIKIHNIYLFAIFLDIFQIFSYLVYSFSVVTFTYVILTVFTIQGITFEIARIHTVDFMQDEKVDLKDYLMIRSLMISAAIALGSLSSMVFDYFNVNLNYLFIFLSIIGLFGIYFQIILYKKFKSKVTNSEIIIEKDKKELFEKFRV